MPKKHLGRPASLLLLLFLLLVSSLLNPAATQAASTPNPRYGTVLLSGADWLKDNGGGVDVKANGETTDNLYGGTYQCVELINRLYSHKGWITSNWSGNANQMYATADAVGLTSKQMNGSISNVKAGDVIVFNGGPTGLGHAAVVDSVDNTTVHAISQNVGQTTESTKKNVAWDKDAKTLTWSGFSTIGIVHAPTTNSSTSTPAPPPTPTIDNTVIAVKKLTQADGTNELYWARKGDVFESRWPSSTGLNTKPLIHITQNDIVAFDIQVLPNGQHLLYTPPTLKSPRSNNLTRRSQ